MGRETSFIDCTFTLLKISSIQPANCLHLFFFFLRSAPLIEIIKWIKIYRTTHILTSRNNIFYYLMRRLQSITINFPFNKIISTLCIFVNCGYFSVIVVTYIFSNIWINVPDIIVFNINIYLSVGWFIFKILFIQWIIHQFL